MGLMDSMMSFVLNSMSKEKKEQMMIQMMPLMMDGLNMNTLMPKMMANMLEDVSVDDVMDFMKGLLKERKEMASMIDKIKDAQPMKQMMCKVYQSSLGFDETVRAIVDRAPENGWETPDVRDLQQLYQSEGFSDMTRLQIIYFCDPPGGYRILKDDKNKPLSVMMPTGVSVYETSDGRTEIATMNLGMMSAMFPAPIQEVFEDGARRLEKTLEGIIRNENPTREATALPNEHGSAARKMAVVNA